MNSSASGVFSSLNAALFSRHLRGGDRKGAERSGTSATASSRRKKKNARDEKHATHDTFPHDARPSPRPRRGVRCQSFHSESITRSWRAPKRRLFFFRDRFFAMISPKTDGDSWTRRREAALRRRVEIRGSFWFHPDKTIRSRARRAREPEQRELFRGRGSRWRPPSRSRLVAERRFDGPFGVSGDSREARRTAAKNKKKFCFLRPSSDPILATPLPTTGKRERFSLPVRRRSDSRLPTRGEVSSDGYRNAAKGARCRSDDEDARRYENLGASEARPVAARPALSVSVPHPAPSSVRGCACSARVYATVVCGVCRVTVASGRGTTKAPVGLAKERTSRLPPVFPPANEPLEDDFRVHILLFLRVFVLPDLSASSLEASSSSSSSLACSGDITRFSPARSRSSHAVLSSDPSKITTASFATSAIAPAHYRGSDTRVLGANYGGHETLARLVDGRRLPGTATRDREILAASRTYASCGSRDRTKRR